MARMSARVSQARPAAPSRRGLLQGRHVMPVVGAGVGGGSGESGGGETMISKKMSSFFFFNMSNPFPRLLVEFKDLFVRLWGQGPHQDALSAVVADYLLPMNLVRCTVDDVQVPLLKQITGASAAAGLARNESDIGKITETMHLVANNLGAIPYATAPPAIAEIQLWLMKYCRGGPGEVKRFVISEELKHTLTAAGREEWDRFMESREFGNLLARLVLIKPQEIGSVDGYPAVEVEAGARKGNGEITSMQIKLKAVYAEQGWWPIVGFEMILLDERDENGIVTAILPNFDE